MKNIFLLTPVALLTFTLAGCSDINSALESTNKVLSSTSQVLLGSTEPSKTQSSNPKARIVKEFVVGDKVTSQYEIKDLKFTVEDWGTGGNYIIHTTGTFYNKTNDFLLVNISAPKYDAEGYATSSLHLSVGTNAGDKTRIDDILNYWGKKDHRIDVKKVNYFINQ